MAFDFQVTIDCSAPHELADWWAEALGWQAPEEGGREGCGSGPVHAVRVQSDPQRRGDAAAHPDLRGDEEDLEEGRVVEVVLGGGVQEGGQDVGCRVCGRHWG